MRVDNRGCIRKLGLRTLRANRRRNRIAVLAIALTALLFTSLFTVLLSISSSYQSFLFRSAGSYAHATFKEVTAAQGKDIAAHRLVRAVGLRTVIGAVERGSFSGELSYMDENATRWSYAMPEQGRMPTAGREIALDTDALAFLGVEPVMGAQVTLSYTLYGALDREMTDTFTLVGWWDYDQLLPVHYINISEEYAQEMQETAYAAGLGLFRSDLSVMLRHTLDLHGQMERIERDLGYTWEDPHAQNYLRFGVNWGYATERLLQQMSPTLALGLLALLVLVGVTGYLIIYNIFQISVRADVRYYGLLKTIGVTARQLHSVVRIQAMALCAVGIPLGLVCGYLVGAYLVPAVIATTTLGADSSTVSVSPGIFLGAAGFALITVWLSCAKPARQAGRVSPVEATRYMEVPTQMSRPHLYLRQGLWQMALANLARSRKKTGLVVLSLCLSLVLLQLLFVFLTGLDMDHYLDSAICADFVVSTPAFFRNGAQTQVYLPDELYEQVRTHTKAARSGCGYMLGGVVDAYMPLDAWSQDAAWYYGDAQIEDMLQNRERLGETVQELATVEGLDADLLPKLTVLSGDLTPLSDPDAHAIAVAATLDDYGQIVNSSYYPAPGDTLTLAYASGCHYIDSRTGAYPDETTQPGDLQQVLENSHQVRYTVCAIVAVPHSMSLRYRTIGYSLVLSAEALSQDSGLDILRAVYIFDTPDAASEAAAEAYFTEASADAQLSYESKATKREEFTRFQDMFLLLGGVLCGIVGVVGVLNYFNALLTSLLARRREFAVLQAVGMTSRQLQSMLRREGLCYTLCAVAAAAALSLCLSPLLGYGLSRIFWFYTWQFRLYTLLPVACALPVFLLLGWGIPTVLYLCYPKRSIVQRLREI